MCLLPFESALSKVVHVSSFTPPHPQLSPAFTFRFAKDPKNTAARVVDPTVNPLLSPTEQRVKMERLAQHPTVLPIFEEQLLAYRLRMNDGVRH